MNGKDVYTVLKDIFKDDSLLKIDGFPVDGIFFNDWKNEPEANIIKFLYTDPDTDEELEVELTEKDLDKTVWSEDGTLTLYTADDCAFMLTLLERTSFRARLTRLTQEMQP